MTSGRLRRSPRPSGESPRLVHPAAWWLWAVLLAATAMRTTNPLLLGAVLAVVAFVVAARRLPPPLGRSFAAFVKLAVFVVAVRVVLQVLFGVRAPGHELFALPSVELPRWAAGVSLGGPVTAELLVDALTSALRLAAVLVCFGAVNSLASPYRLLRSLPAVLYEAGVVVTVALAFAPQAVIQAGRVRDARRLRGRPTSGLAGARGIVLPVLEGALERSVALAASMDTRGYGRRADLPDAVRRSTTTAGLVGLLAVCVGTYGVLDAAAPAALGLPVLGLGALLLAVALFSTGRRSPRTRYRPDPFALPEWLVVASGIAALAGVVVVGRLDPAALTMPIWPLALPAVPVLALAGIALAVTPAWTTPPVPGLTVASRTEPDDAPTPRAVAA